MKLIENILQAFLKGPILNMVLVHDFSHDFKLFRLSYELTLEQADHETQRKKGR